MIATRISVFGLAGVLTTFLLMACATSMPDGAVDQSDSTQQPPSTEVANLPGEQTGGANQRSPVVLPTPDYIQPPADPPRTDPSADTLVYPGSGSFIDAQAASRSAVLEPTKGDITLNFEETGIREVVKTILGDILQENYIIDPAVRGKVTVLTSRPLPRAALVATLETLLRMNNAALVQVDDLYKVVPVAKAAPGTLMPRLGDVAARPGYRVRIVPLRYISAIEMEKILKPFMVEGAALRVDADRNLLILAGTARELALLEETIDIFDVNWLEGMSVGFFTLRNIEPEAMAVELDQVFGASAEGPLAGMFRFVPMERLGAVLVITPQEEFLEQARVWIQRLDRVGEYGVGERLFVYNVQNSRAEHLAAILNDVLGARKKKQTPGAKLAPGRKPAQIASKKSATKGQQRKTPARQPATRAQGGGAFDVAEVRVIADEENNALVILAAPQDYEIILVVLRKLDVTPRQVLVEATIAEVRLEDELRYGVQWFFKHSVGSRTGNASFDLPATTGGEDISLEDLEIFGNGFSYAITTSSGAVRALLNALAGESNLKILSSPQVMVVDNQSASIEVVEQVPVVSTTRTDVSETTSVEFKDAGVQLAVTPRVNEGGLVTMELEQDVTDVGNEDPVVRGQRSFLKRNIKSTVAIQSGQSIVLGGLIRENQSNAERGVPGLYKLPVLGALFGNTENSTTRTELIVMITPRVMRDSREAQQVTDELKRRMQDVGKTWSDFIEL